MTEDDQYDILDKLQDLSNDLTQIIMYVALAKNDKAFENASRNMMHFADAAEGVLSNMMEIVHGK